MKPKNHVSLIILHTLRSQRLLTAGKEVPFSLPLLYFGFLLLTGLLESGRESLLTVIGQKMTHALRNAMCQKLSATGSLTVQSFFGMSVGTSVAVISYISQVFSPLESIGMEIQTIRSAIAGVHRIHEFLDQPQILLLDEITANLDATTEQLVLTALKKASANRTVLSISHRLHEQTGGRTISLS